MRSLIRVAVVAAALAALPGRASELGLLVDKQFGGSQTFGSYHFDGSKPGGYGIRGVYTILDLNVAEVGLSATYHPEQESDLSNSGTLNNQYIAIGAQVDWKFLVNLHAGIDIRREKLTTDGNSIVPNGSTTYTRPWIKAGIGYALPSPVVSPFVRLEVAVAATKQGSLNSGSSADDFRKAMAPDYQIGLYGGIRF
ncbi:MAG TPA: hypothetical protein PKM35_00365 [Holophaga sp.]|nr:hypothetical protein [Holophaga sp.]HPS66410.1 hypothetical protein [Holophaga sp.]